MALTDVAIRNTKATAGPIILFDGDGQYLLVNPSGSRLWRFKYRIEGREKLIALGSYPEVPLKLARERREQARCRRHRHRPECAAPRAEGRAAGHL